MIALKLGEWYLSKLMFRSVFILGILLRARKSDHELKDMRKMIADTGKTEATDSLIFSKRMILVFMWGRRVLSIR